MKSIRHLSFLFLLALGVTTETNVQAAGWICGGGCNCACSGYCSEITAHCYGDPQEAGETCGQQLSRCESYCATRGGVDAWSCQSNASVCFCEYPDDDAPACNPPGACQCDGWGCSDNGDCCSGACYTMGHYCQQASPILINLENNSSNYHLTSAADGVLFDMDGGGELERLGWTSPRSPVAFLVLDRNGNSVIDDGSELMGNATRLSDGTIAANGFEVLVDLDGGPKVTDGQIDETDPIYSRLQLWLDSNHNGRSEYTELFGLQRAGVTAIFTAYWEDSKVDRNGNDYRLVGSALVRRNGRDVSRRIFDVFLKAAPTN